jgi:hypothetical protein
MFDGTLFHQPNNELPTGAKKAPLHLCNARLLRYFLKKNHELPARAKKLPLQLCPTLDCYIFKTIMGWSKTSSAVDTTVTNKRNTTDRFDVQIINKM